MSFFPKFIFFLLIYQAHFSIYAFISSELNTMVNTFKFIGINYPIFSFPTLSLADRISKTGYYLFVD